MRLFRISLLILCTAAMVQHDCLSQEVPHPVDNTGIYTFLDELANDKIISINSAVKPFSRLYIAQKLNEADLKSDMLNPRQRKELHFYLSDFGKELNSWPEREKRRDLFYYRDSVFSLTINPILGGEIFRNQAGNATYWRNGLEARAYIKNWGFYASLRDNHEKPLLARPAYLTKREGGHIKGSSDWSEMQGGVTYAWGWGNAGLVKERVQWGNNYNGANIMNGTNPSFMQFKLQLNPVKWFSFNYFHGWLNSMVVDSSASYWVSNSYGEDYREVYHKKYIAANMFTFIPVQGLNISAGNSIIYTDRNISPAYMVPLFFYKSVDHSQTSGIDNMNSQMFIDVSSRQIRHLHLYATWFIDELSVSRFGKDDEWNFFSWKTGFRLTDLPLENLSVTTEFTYTYPLAFQHYVPTLTYETAGFNLGHYLRDNSKEWYVALDYRPFRTLDINIFYQDASRGPDYTRLGGSRIGNPPLETIEWSCKTAGVRAGFQIMNDLYVWTSAIRSITEGNPDWSPGFFSGRKNTLNAGITAGF